MKRDLWGGEFWTDGYYVATVGERADWGVVERYVKNQGKPKEELRQLELFYYPVVLPRGRLLSTKLLVSTPQNIAGLRFTQEVL